MGLRTGYPCSSPWGDDVDCMRNSAFCGLRRLYAVLEHSSSLAAVPVTADNQVRRCHDCVSVVSKASRSPSAVHRETRNVVEGVSGAPCRQAFSCPTEQSPPAMCVCVWSIYIYMYICVCVCVCVCVCMCVYVFIPPTRPQSSSR